MLLIIDNYDSFTFNLAHYFKELACDVMVKRNDQISLADIKQLAPSHLVVSPGPSTPDNAGISLSAIETFAGTIPILGVCLGHQAIAQVFGGKITHAHQVVHGKTSLIQHCNHNQLFDNIPINFYATRYHSLIVDTESLPDCLQITATCQISHSSQLEIMALAHKTLPIYSVQFHPESIKTEYGHQLLQNFLMVHVESSTTATAALKT